MYIEGGKPYFLQGGSHGVLLVHGFTGLPSEMLLLARFLHDQNYTVLCVRLAGHGTSPLDMARTNGDDWYQSVRDGYELLASCCQKVSAIGLSMGGTLSLMLAADKDIKLASCCTLAAPIYIHENMPLHLLPKRERCKGRFFPKKRRKMEDVPPECNSAYSDYPLDCVYELFDIIDRAKKLLPQVKCPLLVIHSHNDHTARDRSAQYIYDNSTSYNKELIWLEESGHLLTLDCERNTVFKYIASFLTKEIFD